MPDHSPILRITGTLEQGQRYWVAACNELPITSSGDTLGEALEGIDDAASAYLGCLQEMAPEEFDAKIEELREKDREVDRTRQFFDIGLFDLKGSSTPVLLT